MRSDATAKTNLLGRLLMRRRKGQAMPLAALGLLIMVISIIATMNLSQAVYQKMRVQNAADSAAYSLAAMEARAFNFVALTNRVQVAHYNTALVLQSYLSYAGFVVAMSNTVRDMLAVAKNVNDFGCSTLIPPANTPFCVGARICQIAMRIMGQLLRIAKSLYNVLHWLVKEGVDAISRFNKFAIWEMQFLRLFLVNAHLLTGMYEFVEANDDEMGLKSENIWFNVLLNAVFNSLEFRSVFDKGAGMNPFALDAIFGFTSHLREYKNSPNADGVKEARAVMAEMINASRNNEEIYDRSGYVIAASIGAIFGEKMGQTKVVDEGDVGPEVAQIRDTGQYIDGADTLASDDFVERAIGVIGGPGVAILTGSDRLGDGMYADDDGGEHYRYRESGTSPGGPGGMGDVIFFPFPSSVTDTFETESSSEGKHNFRLAPFFKFKPNGDPTADYGQPSTWIFLNKSHEDFQTGDNEKPWHYDFDFTHGALPTASLDTTIGGERNSFMFEGLNVVSRGMVYYHRPDCWDEHPNFFNPFWRARLAPVGGALQNLYDRFVSNNLTVEGSAEETAMEMMRRWIVNFLRNALADVFFRVVTSVMTH
jgi:hypothetical protein